jgi:prepilin-type N-terminal cleavage/methylation domain-containing protein
MSYSKQAFSLVELSIVLVILGLLTGGILTGQNLIRAAELRAVVTQYTTYQTAAQTFRNKYFAIPGDMTNATAFWGDNSSACADAAVADGTPGTCNGDGNGRVDVGGNGGETAERFQVWNQLALAGLIEGTYTGVAGSGGGNDHVAGENSPAGKVGQSGWGFYYNDVISGHATYFDGSYGNTLLLGGVSSGSARDNQPLVSPEEIWGVDKKVDDGMPATGRLVPRNRMNGCTLRSDGSAMTSDAAGAADIGALYNLSDSSVACAFLFKNAL